MCNLYFNLLKILTPSTFTCTQKIKIIVAMGNTSYFYKDCNG